MLSIRRRPAGGWPGVVAILFIVAGVVGACQAGSAAPGAFQAAPAASAAPAGAAGSVSEGELAAGGDQTGAGQPRALSPADQGLLIIKTGTLSLQVTALDDAINTATQQVQSLGGFASGSDRSGDGDDAQATITFRIPAARWDDALKGLRHLADKVLTEQTKTQDVTGQVIDLGARIRNLEATEKALQAIMDRAQAIKDVLSVQAELTKVRGEIEEMTTGKSHLQEQAAMSTLTVSFALKPNPVQAEQQQFDPGSEAERASASLVNVLQGVATAGIWFAIVWLPILIFLAIVGGIAFVVIRRVRGAGPGEAPPIDAPPIEPSAEAGA